MIDIQTIEKELKSAEAKADIVRAECAEAESIIEEKTREIERLDKLLEACRIVAKSVEQKAHKKVSDIVTKCLNAIFEDPYKFELVFEQKRGKTECRPVFIRGENVIEDPLNASGYGVVDVASFALRLAAILCERPCKRRLLVLDEPFKFLSQKYRQRIADLLEDLSTKYETQIVMVTHIEELKTGTILSL